MPYDKRICKVCGAQVKGEGAEPHDPNCPKK